MKKKKIVIAIILIIVSSYFFYNELFPVAKEIKYPSIENIKSIEIGKNKNNTKEISGTDFVKIVLLISGSKPTRILSVNDTPIIKPYYRIKVITDQKIFNYYIYEEDKKIYLESPYEGVYIIDREILNIILKWI